MKAETKTTIPNPLFDREIQSLQLKIQQTLLLKDEEVERLSNRLKLLKSQIVNSKERIESLDKQISDTIEFNENEKNRQKLSLQEMISRAKSKYQLQLQNIHKQHLNEITELQNDFENQLKIFPNSNDQSLVSTMTQIDDEINKYKLKIETYRTQTLKAKETQEQQNPDQLSSSSTHIEIIASPIEKLQNTIQQRNIERYDNLKQSKEQLAHYLQILESMIESHNKKINEEHQKLHELDAAYEQELVEMEEKHKFAMEQLYCQFQEANKRTQTLLKASRHLELSNQQQMKETLKSLDQMKQKSLEIADSEVLEGDEKQQRQRLFKEIAQLKHELTLRDDELKVAQDDNLKLKREIWRIRHEFRFLNSPSKL